VTWLDYDYDYDFEDEDDLVGVCNDLLGVMSKLVRLSVAKR